MTKSPDCPFSNDSGSIILDAFLFSLIASTMRPMFKNSGASFRTSLIATLCVLLLPLMGSASLVGQTTEVEGALTVGIESVAKLGKWIPVFVELEPGQTPPTQFEVLSLDGEATEATYRGAVKQVGERLYEAWTRIGRNHGTLTVRLLDADGGVVASHQRNVATIAPSPATSSHQLIIGGDQELYQMLSDTWFSLYGNAPHQVIPLLDAQQLPTCWIGYDSMDSVFLSTADPQQLAAISEAQWDALQEWVERGGRLYVSANGAHGELAPEGSLNRFLVGEYVQTTELKSMVRLDSYAKNRLDAESLTIAELKVDDGKIELANEGTPLVVRQVRGLGQIVFATLDVADEVLLGWKGHPALLAQFLESREVDSVTRATEHRGSRVSHHGFTDLSGQLKIPLEKFTQVRMINFTVVAVLIGLYILCIGPGDFFFLKKVTGRMELTWISFTLITVLFGALAFWLSGWTKPASMQVNQLEIIDIDQASGRVRGNAWTNVFSPRTGQHLIDFQISDQLGVTENDHLVGWLGTPGDGLGGMQANAGLATGQSPYDVPVGSADGNTSAHLERLPFQVASTRALHTEWAGRFRGKIESRLRFENSRLVGQLTNPFPFELKNVRVMYGNYTYILNDTLAAGTPIDIGSETNERTGKSYLTRRSKSVEKKDRGQNMPWDPTSSRLDRIADMMMFYEIAGGQDYTSLTHGFQNRIEMSDQVSFDRAVFVGEMDTRSSQITIDGEPAGDHYDKQLTIFRIVLPVD